MSKPVKAEQGGVPFEAGSGERSQKNFLISAVQFPFVDHAGDVPDSGLLSHNGMVRTPGLATEAATCSSTPGVFASSRPNGWPRTQGRAMKPRKCAIARGPNLFSARRELVGASLVPGGSANAPSPMNFQRIDSPE